jgi:hypothetical protein
MGHGSLCKIKFLGIVAACESEDEGEFLRVMKDRKPFDEEGLDQ